MLLDAKFPLIERELVAIAFLPFLKPCCGERKDFNPLLKSAGSIESWRLTGYKERTEFSPDIS
jgi:hypothetical protein